MRSRKLLPRWIMDDPSIPVRFAPDVASLQWTTGAELHWTVTAMPLEWTFSYSAALDWTVR